VAAEFNEVVDGLAVGQAVVAQVADDFVVEDGLGERVYERFVYAGVVVLCALFHD
jgi:hypothetical protein